jgi:poly(A) polymerase
MTDDGELPEQNPYAGRWVARLRGKIVANGGSPEQARSLALSRYKENPEIIYIPMDIALKFPPLLADIRAALPDYLVIYLVGGAVRDALLGRRVHDLDFAVERDGIKIAKKVADALGASFYPLDPERDTGRAIAAFEDGSPAVLDFATFRGPDLEADLRGRDFTVNAIAYDLKNGTLHDPLGGGLDLKDRNLRACSSTSFSDDPIRILRSVRLAAEFNFHLLPDTRTLMKAAIDGLQRISAERLRDELFRILDGAKPAVCVRVLDTLAALPHILPELAALKAVAQPEPHVHDVWEHTLAVVAHLDSILASLAPAYDADSGADLLSGLMIMRLGRYRQQVSTHLSGSFVSGRSLRSLLFLAALYHDIAKPLKAAADEDGRIRFWGHDEEGGEIVSSRAQALVLSGDEIDHLKTIVRLHMRLLFHANQFLKNGKMPSRRAIYRFYRDAGEAGVDVCLLALADTRATYETALSMEAWSAVLDVARLFLEAWWEKRETEVLPVPFVNGNDLIKELKLQPGRMIGELLEAVREAQAIGEVTSRDQALDLARKKLQETV